MGKSKDLLAEVDSLKKPHHYRAWLGALSADDQQTVLEIRNRWQAGHYTAKGIQKAQLHAFLKEKLGITVGVPAFRTWLDEESS
jgi:hypothetical protein